MCYKKSMPRTVDRAGRRAELAGAVWRVVAREGVEGASVRKVAEEAGLSPGSLRHFFPSQAHLLRWALELVGQRLEARLVDVRRASRGDGADAVGAMVAEMLPLDEDRRLECHVWLAFTARSLVDPSLQTAREELDTRLGAAFEVMVALLDEGGALGAGRDRALEAQRLYAVVDGLIVHSLLRQDPGGGVLDIVAAHLRELAVPA